jgi:glycosyltransferase involved in cell wall biosynthesis
MPRLTLSMIVKNEQAKLAECLSSVEGIADEIVIVDTGSKDNTKSIAKSFGAQVFDFEWVNDFSKARNFALSKSNGNWILYLDADETLDTESKIELTKLLNNHAKLGVRCIVESSDDFNNSPITIRYPRLFKNSTTIEFCGKVHEQIENSLIENGYKFVDSKIKIWHSGYNLPENELEQKAERNLKILLDDYYLKPSGYLAYQIANSCALLKNREEASKYFNLALEDISLESEYHVISLASLAGFELEQLNFENAEKYIEQGLKLNPSDANFFFTSAQVYFKTTKLDLALGAIKRAFELNENDKSSSYKRIIIKIDSYKIIYMGIEISLAANNGSYFNYFCKLLDEKNKDNTKRISFDESAILKSLINLGSLDSQMIESLSGYISKASLPTYLHLLENTANPQFSVKVLEPIKTKFNDNELFHLTLGNSYLALGDKKNGEATLLLALKLNHENPSTYFFLISFYLSTGKNKEVSELLIKAESVFENNKMVLSKFDDLKEKIKCLTA